MTLRTPAAIRSPGIRILCSGVLGIIARRIRVLGLGAAPPAESRARGSRRRPAPPGLHATIVVHEGMDPAERAEIEALIDQRRQCEPGDVSPPKCVTDETQ